MTDRRGFLAASGAALCGLAHPGLAPGVSEPRVPGVAGVTDPGGKPGVPGVPGVPGRLKQSACRWPYRHFPLPDFCRAAAAMGLAAQHGVTICLELLNSKVDHADYQGDRTAFGVAVVRAVASPRVKLLYDIYHMQIMEGDVIRTIRDNKEWIAHFHTGGVPGRHELDGTQELNWRAVAGAIADTGFAGFMAHEFTPTRDPLTSFRQAVETCTV